MRPRVTNLKGAAAYVGVSYWTMRDYVIQGLVRVVELPPMRAKEGEAARRVLNRIVIEYDELDRFLDERRRVVRDVRRAS
jgi:predicted site-specific integrase-resolvase